MTLYPEREDDKITCGPANEEGIFEVTMHLDGPTFACAMGDEGADFDVDVDVHVEDEADIQAAMAEMSAQLQEIGAEDIEISFEAAPPDEGAHDLHLIGIVSHSDATSHDVIVLDENTRETTATRMTFTPKGKGTLVTMEERSAPMARGFALGFWWQDDGTDYLIDEIDRAEERTLRANRSAGQASLLEDIALRLTSREEPVTPAE
ncbi:hypothetical protein KUL25_20725 [Rhodobacteraceae bacterium N5(2021)]|uniref:Uncharacterized protein n=1 Tax=Gymnodinialimonas phycosphaerae TaxID=2841589 RepID=A0A975TW13_9RHOB|nr:hypothetical protein [Gymnodinialimonas phycosphaerae]MBY4895194.1 hypothetical protein [Gymnodinialimonas phycosphaerae]